MLCGKSVHTILVFFVILTNGFYPSSMQTETSSFVLAATTRKVLSKVEPLDEAKVRWSAPSMEQRIGLADPVPSEAIEFGNFDVELEPRESLRFEMPLQKGGTLITVRFVPDEGRTDKKPTVKPYKKRKTPVTSAGIEREIDRAIQEQQQQKMEKVLSFVLYVDEKSFLPVDSLSNQHNFLIRVGIEYSRYQIGKGILRNLVNRPLAGKIYIASMDITKKEKSEEERRRQEIGTAIEEFRNPDMLWIFNHTLRRHLSGYPGGKSAFEKDFVDNLTRSGVSGNVLRKISEGLEPYDARMTQRVQEKSLTRLSIRQSIKRPMIRKTLKLQRGAREVEVIPPPGEAPKPSIKVLYPNGGEMWTTGKTYTIRWSTTGKIDRVRILLIDTEKDLKYWVTYGEDSTIENDGTYTYKVPRLSNNPGGPGFKIQVMTVDRKVTDESDRVFTITPQKEIKPSIKVLYPNGGETWTTGKMYTIRWSTTGKVDRIRILLIDTEKDSKYWVTGAIENDGSYTYKVPNNTIGLGFKIQVMTSDRKVTDESDRAFSIMAAQKYKIRLLGVMSHRCADDEGWELGCDEEEPYILWTCFGPKYEAFGRTENGRGVVKNEFYLFSQDVNVFGAGSNRALPTFVHDPLICVHMVIEKDSGSPSREHVIGLAKAAVATAKALSGEDWERFAEEATGFFYDLIVLFQKLSAKGDDEYPPFISTYDNEVLFSLTSGSTSPPPIDAELVRSIGNYDHVSIRRVNVYKDPFRRRKLQWSVYYLILRSD